MRCARGADGRLHEPAGRPGRFLSRQAGSPGVRAWHGAVSCNVEMGGVGGKGRVTLGAYVMLPDGSVTCPADVGV